MPQGRSAYTLHFDVLDSFVRAWSVCHGVAPSMPQQLMAPHLHRVAEGT